MTDRSERFQLFRLSLLPRAQRDAFHKEETREEFLRRVFGEQHELSHYKAPLVYEPDAEAGHAAAVFGRLGRRKVVEENLPPSQHLAEVTRETWKACLLVIDPGEHADGQKVALQVDREIGGPTALMNALAKAINADNPHAPFFMQATPIFDASSFWDFAEENRGQVTSITFEFVAPNGLWNTRTTIKKELAALRASTKTEQVITTLKSNEGLDTNSERIKEGVEYAEKGSGRIRAKARGKKTFNSTERPKLTTMEEQKATRGGLIAKAKANLKRLFGRE